PFTQKRRHRVDAARRQKTPENAMSGIWRSLAMRRKRVSPATYGSERGQPPFDPTMMTALLLHSYCCGIYSSRRIAKACRERVDFMSIVALDAPDFRTISEFRK